MKNYEKYKTAKERSEAFWRDYNDGLIPLPYKAVMKHKAHCKHVTFAAKEPWCELTHEECAVSRKRCPMYERAKEKDNLLAIVRRVAGNRKRTGVECSTDLQAARAEAELGSKPTNAESDFAPPKDTNNWKHVDGHVASQTVT